MAHVVFVGLGFGGLYTLRHFLDDAPEDVRVTAIDRRDRFVFTPLLYEYLAEELEPDVVAPPYDDLIQDDRVDRLRAEVIGVELDGKQVRLAQGEPIRYDALVLAPGSVPAFHGVTGAEAHGLPFYCFEDAARLKQALELREWAHGSRPVCVVGGGVVGIELAFALAGSLERLGVRPPAPPVLVLEAMDDILRDMSDGVRERARARLEEVGIEVRTDVRVERVEDESVTFREGAVERELEVAVVAWAAGVEPGGPLVAALPAERHGRHGVVVTSTLQLPAAPDVFVLGDAISRPGREYDEPVPDTAQAALQQAETCAANLVSHVAGEPPADAFRYRSLGDFLRVGPGDAIADVKGVVAEGTAAALARRAAYLARLPRWATRLAALRQWLG